MKRSQIQIGETIAVLFVFIILVFVGLIVYSGFERSKIRQKTEEHIGISATEVAQRALFLPEVACSSENIQRFNCFDMIKLEKSHAIMDANFLMYRDLLLESRIIVRKVFPAVEEDASFPATCYDGILNNAEYLVDCEMGPAPTTCPLCNTVNSGTWILYDNKPDLGKWDSMLTTINPVTIFDPLADKGDEHYFGLLIVEVYT